MSNLVTILDTSLIHEIYIAKNLLSQSDIESFIFDENLSTIGIATIEGYKLKVNSADVEMAKELLKTINL